MKVIILAGGLGTRISEETYLKPKPMIEIGGKPILWHIMKYFSFYGHNDFIICCGYKGEVIKNYFHNYFLLNSDVTFDLNINKFKIHSNSKEKWKVTLIDTGQNTETGGRLKNVGSYLKNDENFFFTYGDGLSDVNLDRLLKFHTSSKSLATVTAVQPPGRYGALSIDKKCIVKKFEEKPSGDGAYVNGGYFILNKKCIKFINNNFTKWEEEPLENLAKQKKLRAFKHNGFWRPLDTLRDKKMLQILWEEDKAPWKKWK
jgi:glucose-1-phosphate cytidylyltransferase